VQRRWTDRPLPNLRRRFRANREEATEEGGIGAVDAVGLSDGPLFAIAVAVAVVLFIFVLLPLLGVALELIALLLVFSSGVLGRVLLGRPWVIEATNLDDGERSVAFEVKGWRGSSRAIERLKASISAAGPPASL
jgi:hypothetical protein